MYKHLLELSPCLLYFITTMCANEYQAVYVRRTSTITIYAKLTL